MANLLLHPLTAKQVADFVRQPAHALLIIGPQGIGKSALVIDMAAQLLGVSDQKLAEQPYVSFIRPTKEHSISIAAVRTLEHFMSLKVPGDIKRIAIIEDAHLLTMEAQNALLKTLEEPPKGTYVLLTAANEQALLPTIRSRTQILTVKRPATNELVAYFSEGYDKKYVQQALLISGGLPGLTEALLTGDQNHPLVIAVEYARQIVQKSSFERLTMIDSLTKERELCLDIFTILQQMAHIALTQSNNHPKKWQHILATSYKATELLLQNAQPKLVLTDVMLSL